VLFKPTFTGRAAMKWTGTVTDRQCCLCRHFDRVHSEAAAGCTGRNQEGLKTTTVVDCNDQLNTVGLATRHVKMLLCSRHFNSFRLIYLSI